MTMIVDEYTKLVDQRARSKMDEQAFWRKIGAKVRQARQKARLSQAELAQRVNRTPAAICKLEKGYPVSQDLLNCVDNVLTSVNNSKPTKE